jgi:hypothetical protein
MIGPTDDEVNAIIENLKGTGTPLRVVVQKVLHTPTVLPIRLSEILGRVGEQIRQCDNCHIWRNADEVIKIFDKSSMFLCAECRAQRREQFDAHIDTRRMHNR